jgi:ATP-dependent RNA helicase HelY
LLTLDPFQQRALAALDRGHSVLVAAPTGAGKTLVADAAVDRALAAGRKAFYTTPLKALSNQKFRDLATRLGADNVGLLTGDRTVRPDAPVVVMTTEVLRALLYEGAAVLDGLGAIVLDEFHYLQDPDRGPVWEEVVVHAPDDVALVCLSATLPDLAVLHAWLEEVHGPTELVVEEQRPVTLQFLYAVGNLQGTPPLVLPMFVDGRLNPTAEIHDGVRKTARGEGRRVRDRARPVTPTREQLLDHLREHAMLPAIWFVLSRSGCDRAVAACVSSGIRLTSHDETARIASLVSAATDRLDASEARTLDAGGWRLALACGVAAHHGGMAPLQREVVELAAAEGLVKVVFATETLALGVNLPARTVVIDRVVRATGDTLTSAEVAQLAGRAGRRGLDRVGHVIVPWAEDVPFHRVSGLADGGRAETLRSHFRATPAMVANLLHRYGVDDGRRRFRRSLAHHLLEDTLADLRTMLANLRAERALSPSIAELSATCGIQLSNEHAVAALRVGDVVVDPGRASVGRLVVVAPPRVRRGQAAIDTVGADCRRVVVTANDFRAEPVVVGRLDLSHLAETGRGFAREVAELLRALPEVAVEATSAPERKAANGRSAARVDDEMALVSARLSAEEAAYDDEFDAVADLLRRRGHVEGWRLTTSGHMVRRLFHERGLLVAECMAAGLLEGLDPPSLAALVSAFRSGVRDELTPSPFPTAGLRARWIEVEAVSAGLQRAEAEANLVPTPPPDAALLAPLHRWASGADLARALAGSGGTLGAGDLAREARQVVELLEQVRAVASPATAATAVLAIDAIARGVVVASAHDQ